MLACAILRRAWFDARGQAAYRAAKAREFLASDEARTWVDLVGLDLEVFEERLGELGEGEDRDATCVLEGQAAPAV